MNWLFSSLSYIWSVGAPGFIVGAIFLGSMYFVWRKDGKMTYGRWCAIVAFWFVIACLLKVMGFAN